MVLSSITAAVKTFIMTPDSNSRNKTKERERQKEIIHAFELSLTQEASDLLLRMNPNDLTPDERGRLRRYAHHFSSGTSTEHNQEPPAAPIPSQKRKLLPSSKPTTTDNTSTPQPPSNTNTRESNSADGNGPSKRRRGRPLGSLNRPKHNRASLPPSGFDENENGSPAA